MREKIEKKITLDERAFVEESNIGKVFIVQPDDSLVLRELYIWDVAEDLILISPHNKYKSREWVKYENFMSCTPRFLRLAKKGIFRRIARLFSAKIPPYK